MKRSRMKLLLSLALAVPGLLMLRDFAAGAVLAMDLLHPSGELAVRLMILAMLPGPLVEALGSSRFLRGWLMVRRNLGVAAFGYAMLHLVFYIADMGMLSAIVDELTLPAIWTGWLALALMAVPAAISFDRAVRSLGRRWKLLQRLVYAAFVVALVHWLLLDWEWLPGFVHLLPLIAAWTMRALARGRIHRLGATS